MALDPQAQEVINLVIKSGRPAYNTLSPKDARQLFRETRPGSTPTPAEIGTVRDLTADGPGGPIPLRVYRPAGVPAGTPLPVLVFYHGGGWVIGDLDTHDVQCRQITAEAGITVVAVDYRLAPEHKFPAAIDDAWAATRWVVAHGSELGVDGRRLAVAGDSAGGNLAAVVALMARDAGGPAIALQVLIYPVTDVGSESKSYRDFAEGYMLTREGMRWFTNHYLKSPSDAQDWRASPLRAAVAGRASAGARHHRRVRSASRRGRRVRGTALGCRGAGRLHQLWRDDPRLHADGPPHRHRQPRHLARRRVAAPGAALRPRP